MGGESYSLQYHIKGDESQIMRWSSVEILSNQFVPYVCPQDVPSVKVTIKLFITFYSEFYSIPSSLKAILK